MGSILNKATAPFGVKLLPGGPYADGGLGDKQQSQQASADQVYNQLGDYGRNLLGTTGGAHGANAFDQYNQSIMGLEGAAGSGLTNPEGYASKLDPLLKQYGQTGGVDMNDPNADPFALLPHEQEQLNQGLNDINTQSQTSAAHARQTLAARGITSGPMLDNMLQRINDHYGSQAQQHTTQFHETARANRASTIQNLLTGYSNLTGIQTQQHGQRVNDRQQVLDANKGRISTGTGLVGAKASGLMNSAQMTGQQADRASANTNQAWGGISSLAGFAGGGGFAGTPPPPRPFLGGTAGQTGNSANSPGDFPLNKATWNF